MNREELIQRIENRLENLTEAELEKLYQQLDLLERKAV